MFQRQARNPFPARNLFILGAAVLGFLYFLLKNVQTTHQQPAPEEKSAETGDSSRMRPEEWFFTVREWPDLQADLSTYMQALDQARTQEKIAENRGPGNGFSAPWTVEGPGNIGARINCIAVHPTKPNTILIGYANGGVWKTTNGGLSWRPVFDNHNFLAVSALAFDPSNPNVVYAGTGDHNISILPMLGDGVWRSADEGESWQAIGLAETRVVSRIIVDPQSSGQLYVATMGLPFERNPQRGLYKTSNGGNSWTQSLYPADQAGIIDVVMSPADHNTLYAAGWDRIRNNKESLIIGPNARIWKTTDGGANWVKLGGGLPEDDGCRIGLAIDPANANHVFASYVGTDLHFAGLFESFDAGETWKQNNCEGLDYGFQSDFAWYFGQIRINPFNSQDIWMLGVQTWRSTDGGETWFLAAGFGQDIHADHHDLKFLAQDVFLLATDGGLYRSVDDGSNWEKIENIPTNQIYRVAYNPHDPDYYYGGAQDNGTSRGNAAVLENWDRVFGGDGFQAVFHPGNPNIFYYETQNGYFYGTTDGGSFDNGWTGIDDADRRSWDMPYAISRNNPEIMYAGTYRIYQSSGHLAQWTPVSEDLTDGIIYAPRFHTISTLNESPLNNDLLYAGTTDGNVWAGHPFSQVWTNVSDGLPDRYVSAVKASETNVKRVFVSHTGYKDNDFTPHIHRSDDQGAHWTSISGDLPNLAVNDIIVLPGTQDSVIFAATDGGVYGTLNGGTHWERLGTGMPIIPVFSLGINPSKHTLFAGTYARSIQSFPLDSLKFGSSGVHFPENAGFELRISPNPASSFARVSLENEGSALELQLSDLSGKALWNKKVTGKGKLEETVDLQGYAPGVYLFYAKRGGRIVWSEKLVLGSSFWH